MSNSRRNLIVAIIVLAGALLLLCICAVGAWFAVRPSLDRADFLQGLQPTAAITRQVAPATATPARSQPRATATPAKQPSAPANPPTAPVLPTAVQAPAGADIETALLTNLYERVNPSVVNITVLGRAGEQVAPGMGIPTPENPDELVPVSQGSGFVWDAEGHIVTNAHVIEGEDGVRITFSDGTSATAEVIGADPDSDLAVVKVDPATAALVPVARGSMDAVQVGQRVAAIGNPFGYNGTLTVGVVSAIGRSISSLTQFNIPSVIQTDAPINPGNSGGPLLNMDGAVIGVNAQIETSNGVRANSGVGFSIPISIVERVVPALINEGVYRHAYLGISGSTFSPFCADVLGIDPAVRGAYVNEVANGGPSDKAGLRGGSQAVDKLTCPEMAGGDLITAIDDQPVARFDDLLIYLETYKGPGDTVTLTVLRDGQEQKIAVELGRRPQRSQ
ncbi:MAG: trypsin-like peptidase domain-containing protein [Anaerolineae bacterium]|jgi:2-alkenal reductase|nr:trypsin-like peptidase domain-containing protein [Anaerolineae bacterium]